MANFIKDLTSVGLSKILLIIFGLSTSIITARYLGPEKSGTIASLLVFKELFMTFGSLGIRQSTTYFIGKKIFDEDAIKTAITQIWLISSVFCIISCYFLISNLSDSGDQTFFVILVLLPIPFSLFNSYNSGVFLGKNQIGKFNKINWIPSLIVLILSIILIIIFHLKIKGYLIALIGGPLAISFILLFKNNFINAFSLKFNWLVIKKMLRLGLIYSIALLIINLNTKLDIILLGKLSTKYQIGIYAKGANIIQYLWQIPMLLSTIIFARSASSKKDKEFSIKVTQLLRLSLIFVGLGLTVLYLFSEEVIVGLFGENFKESSQVLNLLLFGVLLLTIFKSMNVDMAGKGKPWVSMKAMIPGLIINVVLNLLWIPEYGANGAALASTISYSTIAVLFLFFYSKETTIPVKDILHFKKSDFDPIIKLVKRK